MLFPGRKACRGVGPFPARRACRGLDVFPARGACRGLGAWAYSSHPWSGVALVNLEVSLPASLRRALSSKGLPPPVHKAGAQETPVFSAPTGAPGLGHTRVRGVVGPDPKWCTGFRDRVSCSLKPLVVVFPHVVHRTHEVERRAHSGRPTSRNAFATREACAVTVGQVVIVALNVAAVAGPAPACIGAAGWLPVHP